MIVGSHFDKISIAETKHKKRVLKSLVDNHNLDDVKIVGRIYIDCRYAESASMSKLRSVLSQSCQRLRSSEEISASLHSFLVYLLDKFKDKLAVTYREAASELNQCLNSNSYLYLECLKSSKPFEMCEKLNERGNILFMKNNEDPDNSWIVFDKAAILSQVNGVIFAPEEFKEHRDLASSTGVVPLSKLTPLFPYMNTDMIVRFLCHLEFCQEIEDATLLPLIAADSTSSPVSSERFFFFPGLVKLEKPTDITMLVTLNEGHCSAWVLECLKSNQFLSSRYLQVLLLRLAFSLALAPDHSTAESLALLRKCKVWKNGIYWANRSGSEAIVEVVNLKQVVVIVHSKKDKIKLAGLRSAIIRLILKTREEFCSKVPVKELLVLPEDAAKVNYPLDSTEVAAVSITEVAQTVKEGEEYVVKDDIQTTELEKIVCFEPYANLGETVLKQLFEENTSEDVSEEITDELFYLIAHNACRFVNEYCAICDPSPLLLAKQCVSQGDVNRLVHIFQLWREKMGKEGTKMNFRNLLDEYSIFAGRNPLKLAPGAAVYNGIIIEVY